VVRALGGEIDARQQLDAVQVKRVAGGILRRRLRRLFSLAQVELHHRQEIVPAREARQQVGDFGQRSVGAGEVLRARQQHRLQVGGSGAARLYRQHAVDVRLRAGVVAGRHQHVGALQPGGGQARHRGDGRVHRGQCPRAVALEVQQLALQQQGLAGFGVQRQGTVDLRLGAVEVAPGDQHAGGGQQRLLGLRRHDLGLCKLGLGGVELVQLQLRHAAHHHDRHPLVGAVGIGLQVAQQLAELALRDVALRQRERHVARIEAVVAGGTELLFRRHRVGHAHLHQTQAEVRLGIGRVVAHGVAQLDLRGSQVALVHGQPGGAERVGIAPVFPPRAPGAAGGKDDQHGNGGNGTFHRISPCSA